jgi:membrane protease YdiL (CAAX protease family)
MVANSTSQARRTVGWGVVVGVLVAWLAAGLLGAFVVYRVVGSEDDALVDPGRELAGVVPSAAALLLIVCVISWLRWWPVVLRDEVAARGWAWLFPLGLLAAGAIATDWGRIGSAGGALIASLAVSVLAVAASEELVFRGFVLRAMRDRYPELTAALVTTLLFGVAHMLNGGFGNVVQGLLSFMTGFLFYAARRASRGIVLPILLHAWWDFAVFSAELGPGSADASSLFGGAVIVVVLFVVALAAYRLWQPRSAASAA